MGVLLTLPGAPQAPLRGTQLPSEHASPSGVALVLLGAGTEAQGCYVAWFR